MGFPPDSTPEKDLVFLQLIFYYGDVSVTKPLNDALQSWIGKFDALAEEEGVKQEFIYLNFAAWFQDPLRAFGKEQFEKLRKVSKKYDPKGFFQKQLVGGFKLFEPAVTPYEAAA
jgi:hypothetical protein